MKAIYIEDGLDFCIRHLLQEEAKEVWGCDEFESVSIIHGDRLTICERITSLIETADVVYFDYGGLTSGVCFHGIGDFIDYWNRFFINQIEEHPNKKWFCVSAVNTFREEDRKQLEAVGVEFHKI